MAFIANEVQANQAFVMSARQGLYMMMTRSEALNFLKQAAAPLGVEWARARVPWVPDPVIQGVGEAVDHVLECVKYRHKEWLESTARSNRLFGPSRKDVRQFLIEFTTNAARDSMHAAGFVADPSRVARQAELKMEADRIREHDHREAKARAQQERRAEQERRRRWLHRPHPAPEPQPYGVSHEGAERLTCAWMRHLGVLDAKVTRFVADGGIDVTSAGFVAQVKNYAGTVPVAEVRALYGSATADGKKALFFTSGTLSVEGAAFADRVGMATFQYDAAAGTLKGLNDLGAAAVEFSISKAFETRPLGKELT